MNKQKEILKQKICGVEPKFAGCVDSLFDMLIFTKSVIGGSSVLASYYDFDFAIGDIDIYTQDEHDVLANYLERTLKIKGVERQHQKLQHMPYSYECCSYIDRIVDYGNIQVMYVDTKPKDVIEQFDFSIVRIGFDGIKFFGSGISDATEKKQCTFAGSLENALEATVLRMKKYKSRGFEFEDNDE